MSGCGSSGGVSAGTQGGINVVPSATVGLQILAGTGTGTETGAGGTASGKITPPLSVTAGVPIQVTVNAVDQYWNVTPSSNPATVTVGTSDSFATNPGSHALTSGTTNFNATLVTAGIQTFTASGAGTSNTSSNITVNAGIANQMLVVLPWETQVQGKYQTAPFGKITNAGSILAGQTLQATVYGVDTFFNIDTTDNGDKIWVSLSSDTYAAKPSSQTLVSGTTVFTLVPVTATSQVVRATSAMPSPLYVTGTFAVNPDTQTASSQRLQLVLSGETAIPGLPPYGISNGGKTGSPQDQYAGIISTVAVRLVDRFYNLITSGLAMTTVKIHTDDPGCFGFRTSRL